MHHFLQASIVVGLLLGGSIAHSTNHAPQDGDPGKHTEGSRLTPTKPVFALFYSDKQKRFSRELEVVTKQLEACHYEVRTFDIGAIADLDRTLSEAGLPGDTPIMFTASHSAPKPGADNSFDNYLLDEGGHNRSAPQFLATLRKFFPTSPKYIDTCYSGHFPNQDSTTAAACLSGQQSKTQPQTGITSVEELMIPLFCDAINGCGLIRQFDANQDRSLDGQEIENYIATQKPEAQTHNSESLGVFFDEASAIKAGEACKPPSTLKVNHFKEDLVVFHEDGKEERRVPLHDVAPSKGIVAGPSDSPHSVLKDDYPELLRNGASFSALLKGKSNQTVRYIVSEILNQSVEKTEAAALVGEGKNRFSINSGRKKTKATLNWELRRDVYRAKCLTPGRLRFGDGADQQTPIFPKGFAIRCK